MGHGGLDNIIHDISKRVTHPKEVTKIRHNIYREKAECAVALEKKTLIKSDTNCHSQ